MTKILVIEDELFVRENIVELLEAEDFAVFSTENGILGILWAQENIPDLVICDVMMPEMNGYEVLSEMRELPMTSLTPFIFLTAMSDKGDIRQGMELGADDYLTKPFTREELLGAIHTRLAKQEKLRQQYDREHQRAEILEQRVKELEQLQIKEEISHEYHEALLKINTAVNLIKKIQPGQKRDRNLRIIQETCAKEISLLKQIPNLDSENPALSLILQN
ncbi:response regulator transcription factor [Pleurocapsa sp. PCC 7319]|uniref:response regulator transcription factor n=1 Tax=Pleurocapsa sp. PCC 7319 TaxID=118161 RepID=UPI00034BFE7B|nr:response regulator [Pleurocapsa sp. PCC 7319]